METGRWPKAPKLPRPSSTLPTADIGPQFRYGPRRRCPRSVRKSARSEELVVSVKPPTWRPAWTFIIQVYGGGSLRSTDLSKSRASVAELPANYCHFEFFGGERRFCRNG